MKKIVISIIACMGIFLLGNTVNARTLSSSTISIVDSLVNNIIRDRSSFSDSKKTQKYESIIKMLDYAEDHITTDKRPIATYIKTVFQGKFAEFQTQESATPAGNRYDSYNIPNVDLQQVRDAWLSRHNTARANKGRYSYTWNSELERSAHIWATYLASINSSTHKRKASDNYYNYQSIKTWFADQGITFDESQGTAFTENIAYQYYSCSSTDCTQNLISAIRKGFDFFMGEASRNGPHYRGIMSKNFTEMGMGVAFVGKRYWIVTHYAVKVK